MKLSDVLTGLSQLATAVAFLVAIGFVVYVVYTDPPPVEVRSSHLTIAVDADHDHEEDEEDDDDDGDCVTATRTVSRKSYATNSSRSVRPMTVQTQPQPQQRERKQRQECEQCRNSGFYPCPFCEGRGKISGGGLTVKERQVRGSHKSKKRRPVEVRERRDALGYHYETYRPPWEKGDYVYSDPYTKRSWEFPDAAKKCERCAGKGWLECDDCGNPEHYPMPKKKIGTK